MRITHEQNIRRLKLARDLEVDATRWAADIKWTNHVPPPHWSFGEALLICAGIMGTLFLLVPPCWSAISFCYSWWMGLGS